MRFTPTQSTDENRPGWYVLDTQNNKRVTQIMSDVWVDGAMIHPGAKKRCRKIARRMERKVRSA